MDKEKETVTVNIIDLRKLWDDVAALADRIDHDEDGFCAMDFMIAIENGVEFTTEELWKIQEFYEELLDIKDGALKPRDSIAFAKERIVYFENLNNPED